MAVGQSNHEQVEKVSEPERYCQVTGLLLHPQQPKSKVVGITTLKHDANTLNLLRKRYGSKQCKRAYHSEEYRLAHGPRNEKSNPPNNLLRRIKRAEADCNLFGLEETLRLTAEHQALLNYFDGTEKAVRPSLKKCIKEDKDTIRDSFVDSETPQHRGVEKTISATGGGSVVRPQPLSKGRLQKKRPNTVKTLGNNVLELFPIEPNGR